MFRHYTVPFLQYEILLRILLNSTESLELIVISIVNKAYLFSLFYKMSGKTSCGITINLLQRTPVFTDGTYLIMLIGHPNYQGYPVCKGIRLLLCCLLFVAVVCLLLFVVCLLFAVVCSMFLLRTLCIVVVCYSCYQRCFIG